MNVLKGVRPHDRSFNEAL